MRVYIDICMMCVTVLHINSSIGAFGKVQKGLLTLDEVKVEVAIKSLKC